MATTPTPLVWDYHRETGASGAVGGVVHYYDEAAQSLFNSGGLSTQISVVPDGHWSSADWSELHAIETMSYTDLDFDHPHNGILFGVGSSGGKPYFLRYVYAMDCTDLVTSGSVSHKNDSASAQLRMNLMNVQDSIFMGTATLFQPGAKIIFKVVVGEEEPYAMCVAYLDAADYDIKSSTVPISGRNTIGYKLMQSTFDEIEELTGKAHEVIASIFEMAGITSYVVEQSSTSRKYEFKPDQTFMSGVEQICDMHHDWKIIELPDGTIIVGSANFISNYQTNGYYVFSFGGANSMNRNLFKRKTKRSSDAAYTRVRITGVDADGNDLEPVIVPVVNYEHWNMPRNKTYHETAPDGLTQSELQEYAEDVALHLQFVGVGEDFTSAIQPHLLIGDVVTVDNGDNTMTPLGIVTDVKHSFGKSGFTTDFSTDSGGLLVTMAEILFTKTKSLNGYNRKQTLKDLIQVASGSSSAGPKTTGATVIKVASGNKNAETLEGKTYQQVVDSAIDAAVNASIDSAVDAANKAAMDAVEGLVFSSCAPPAILNYSYEYSSGSTEHTRVYEGTIGSKLLLIVLSRGELVTTPEGWEQIGVLAESGDKNAGNVSYTQYATMFTKTCEGIETINYSSTESNMSMTCVIEFEGVAGFEILEETRKENVATTEPDFTCKRNSTRMAIWVANSIYFNNDQFYWNVSDSGIWAISDNNGLQPRLGVFVDNRPAPIDFTVSTGMTNRFASIVCLQIVPAATINNSSPEEGNE